MHKIARFLGFALIVQCSLYGADTTVTFSPEEILSEVLYQGILQKYLVHVSAHSLILVNKKFNNLMDAYRVMNGKQIWSIPTSPSRPFTVPLSDGSDVQKLTLTFDASCNKACGIHLPKVYLHLDERHLSDTTNVKPSLHYFSWQSCTAIKKKTLSACSTYTRYKQYEFFDHSISCTKFYCDNWFYDNKLKQYVNRDYQDHVHLNWWLPTGYMIHMQYEDDIELEQVFDYEQKRSIIRCKKAWNDHRILFTIDTGAHAKDENGTAIKWRKIDQIDWDDEMDTDKS